MNNYELRSYFKTVPEEYLFQMFDILASNMTTIAPTGNSYEDDKSLWLSQAVPQFENVILILYSEKVVGYFQYRIIDDTLIMDEIQFASGFHSVGLFGILYRYIAKTLPDSIMYVAACANKKNYKSQRILEHLGLTQVGENKNGNSYVYRGMYQSLLDRYT